MPAQSKDEGKSGKEILNDSKRDDSKQEAKGSENNKIIRKQSESAQSRRIKKWIAFAKSKVSFGFKHLPAGKIPFMSSEVRGVSLCIDKVVGWSVPASVIKQFKRSNNDFGILFILSNKIS